MCLFFSFLHLLTNLFFLKLFSGENKHSSPNQLSFMSHVLKYKSTTVLNAILQFVLLSKYLDSLPEICFQIYCILHCSRWSSLFSKSLFEFFPNVCFKCVLHPRRYVFREYFCKRNDNPFLTKRPPFLHTPTNPKAESPMSLVCCVRRRVLDPI